MLFEPLEARPKLCASSADWVERNPLAGFKSLDMVNYGVKVENVDALRSLAFEDRANLGFKQAQLPRVHRAGAIDSDRNVAYSFPHHSGEVKPRPNVATVGTHPAIVRRRGLGPSPVKQ